MSDDRLAGLPTPYALALRLKEVGADDALIADCVDVDPAAVPALLELGEAKLRAQPGGGDEPPPV